MRTELLRHKSSSEASFTFSHLLMPHLMAGRREVVGAEALHLEHKLETHRKVPLKD